MERVVEQPLVRERMHAEEAAGALHVSWRSREETPRVAVRVPLRRVAGEDVWRVVHRVEADRQQDQIPPELPGKPLLQHTEVIRQTQAEVRQRARRIHEVDDDDLAAQLRE